jgi:D-sedoheptulose 7-phosphate isomerase
MAPDAPDVPAWAAEQLAAYQRSAAAMTGLLPEVLAVADLVCRAYAAGGVVYTFGNGGSAADAQHLTGELIGHYRRDRRPLPAVTLTCDPTVMTCIGNDYDFDDAFARQVEALVRPGDVVVAFSTSGRSPNVVAGLAAGRARGATTVLCCGRCGGPAAEHADVLLAAPADQTARIQELHTLMLHLISEHVDAWAAGEPPTP